MKLTLPNIQHRFAPWPHMTFLGLVPREQYQPVVTAVGAARGFVPLMHKDAAQGGTSTRMMLELATCGGLLGELGAALISADLKRDIFRELAPDIAARFDQGGGVSEEDAMLMPARPWAAIFRDLPGYRNSPHPDGLEKIATVQIYIPPPTAPERMHLGSRFLRGPSEDSEVKQIPFRPNQGYGFVVTEDTWHCVRETTMADGVRESIMLLYFREDARRPAVGPTYWPEVVR